MPPVVVRNRLSFQEVCALQVGGRVIEVDFPEWGLYKELLILTPPEVAFEGSERGATVEFTGLLEGEGYVLEFLLSEKQYAYCAHLYLPENVLFAQGSSPV